jgi:hypothetical protein
MCRQGQISEPTDGSQYNDDRLFSDMYDFWNLALAVIGRKFNLVQCGRAWFHRRTLLILQAFQAG